MEKVKEGEKDRGSVWECKVEEQARRAREKKVSETRTYWAQRTSPLASSAPGVLDGLSVQGGLPVPTLPLFRRGASTGSLDRVESVLVLRFGPRGSGALESEVMDSGRVDAGGEEVTVERYEDVRGTSGGRLASGEAVMGEVKGDSMMVDWARLVEKEKSEGRCEMGGVGRDEGVVWGEVVELGGYEC